MIKTEIKHLEKSELELKVTIPWEKWEKFVDEAVAILSADMKVAGFRKGKIPRHIVEQKIPKIAILEEAANKAIQKIYPEVVTENKLEVIGSPKAELLKIAEGNELEFKVVTAVVPTATVKNWQSSIKKVNKKYAKSSVAVDDEEIDKEVEQIANSRVQLIDVEREARDGDSVLIDFKVLQGGVPIERGTSKNHPLVLGHGVFIPGFEEQIIGMKSGDEKSFELKFPEEYHEKNLAGKPATFEVRVNTVQERKTPEISDAFAKSLGQFDDLAALKKSIKEGMLEEKTKAETEKKRAEYIEEVIKVTEAALPEVLIHEELHRMLGEFEMQIGGMGMTLDAYLEQIKKTREEIEQEWHPQAEKRVLAALALEEIAKQENIEVSSEDIEAEMNKMMAQYKNIKDAEKNVDLGKLYNYIKGTKQNERVFDLFEALQ